MADHAAEVTAYPSIPGAHDLRRQSSQASPSPELESHRAAGTVLDTHPLTKCEPGSNYRVRYSRTMELPCSTWRRMMRARHCIESHWRVPPRTHWPLGR